MTKSDNKPIVIFETTIKGKEITKVIISKEEKEKCSPNITVRFTE